VAEGVFPVLVRPFPTNIRARVAILARGLDELALVDGHEPSANDFPRAGIVGSVKIVGCEQVPAGRALSQLGKKFGKALVDFYPRHYLPKDGFAYFWLLKEPRLFTRPRGVQKVFARTWVRFR
jgi:hypothetical protein